MPQLLRYCLLAALVGVPGGMAGAQPAPSDPDVRKGIALAEEGEYDAAILLLDNAARRLAADPARARDLSTAYLYLGISYLGKGHEAAARANFREAVSRLHDLSLSPEKFSPKVINLVEAARTEVDQTPVTSAAPPPSPAPRPSAVPSAAPAGNGGGGSKKALLIGASVAVAGSAAYLLTRNDPECATVAGLWQAEVSWRGSAPNGGPVAAGPAQVQSILTVLEGGPGGRVVAQSHALGTAPLQAAWTGQAGANYVARVSQLGGGAGYQLRILRPCD